MAARRWVSEETVLLEMERLNDMSLEKAQAYSLQAVKAAEAEAAHKALRAKRALLAKASGVKSIGEAELTAEADETVADAYLLRLVTAAQADAIRESLRSIRTNQDGLRTAAASHRSPINGPGWQS